MQLVLNTEYGGFYFNQEMTDWLQKNRNWTIVKQQDYNYENKNNYPLTTLTGSNDYFYTPKDMDDIEIRSHKDLIDCVKELKKLHENDKYPEKFYGHIHALKIITVKTKLVIQNYHNGKEKISVELQETYD